MRWRARALAAVAVVVAQGAAAAPPAVDAGQRVYDLHCYQCHGYGGDARTLAATFLEPPPRDFTASSPTLLDRERMLRALRDGRPGTGMMSYRAVLSEAEREAVVDYVRSHFLGQAHPELRYHTAANGWPEHERYAAAFPFARGEITLDTPWEALSPAQQQGKRLYMASCISCHDHGHVADAGTVWQAQAVSYPRAPDFHRRDAQGVDAVSGATTLARHDLARAEPQGDPRLQRGAQLFHDNCAFCHAADGSGGNWIGRFLSPSPRDLRTAEIARRDPQALAAVIRSGLPGTSMPAWGAVLQDVDVAAVVAYVQGVLARDARAPAEVSAAPMPASAPGWQRVDAQRAAEPSP